MHRYCLRNHGPNKHWGKHEVIPNADAMKQDQGPDLPQFDDMGGNAMYFLVEGGGFRSNASDTG